MFFLSFAVNVSPQWAVFDSDHAQGFRIGFARVDVESRREFN
jgi:hypothetical protein